MWSASKKSSALTLIGLSILFSLLLWSGLFPWWSQFTPRHLRNYLPRRYWTLAQPTKSDLIPRDYILILGDSNAQGLGEWMLETYPDVATAPNTSHFIHEALDQDVLNWGFRGRSSIGSFVRDPNQILHFQRARFTMEDPSIVLAFFYEGNDLEDNLRELDHAQFFKDHPQLNLVTFQEKFVPLDQSSLSNTLHHYFAGMTFLYNLIKTSIEKGSLYAREGDRNRYQRKPPSPKFNQATIGEKKIRLPDDLQAPPLRLKRTALNKGLATFAFSLQTLRTTFPHARVVVVYVPAVASIYRLEGQVSIEPYQGQWHYLSRQAQRPPIRPRLLFPAEHIVRASDNLYANISSISEQLDTECFDARLPLRKAALAHKLHGPKDWQHLNRLGYETLGSALAQHLKGGLEEDAPIRQRTATASQNAK